jgi:sialic acid synthase SpsE
VTHEPLLRALGGYGRPVLLSTGLATPEEIAQACEALERGAGGAARRPPIVLMQCAVDPLAPESGADVRTVATLRARFGCLVGWSDHGAGYVHAVAAVALGACVVEKPLTDDHRRPGADHARALEPLDFVTMVTAIRSLETGLGDGSLGAPAAAAIGRMRRGIYAARSLPSGTVLDTADLKVVRPALGAEPAALARLVGRRLTRRLAVDEPLGDDECGSEP